MAGGFEKMTAEQFRNRNKGTTPWPNIVEQPIFSAEVYEASGSELVIEIEPMGAPRMTQSDKWAKRPVVERYHAMMNKIRADCATLGYKLGAVVKVRFELSMPESWSDKKKATFAARPHQQRPDVDNLCKGFLDAFNQEDSHVHTIQITKVWAYQGRIVIIR